jgi:hypothetical protein
MKAMTAVNYGGPEDDSPIHRRRFTLAEAADAMPDIAVSCISCLPKTFGVWNIFPSFHHQDLYGGMGMLKVFFQEKG